MPVTWKRCPAPRAALVLAAAAAAFPLHAMQAAPIAPSPAAPPTWTAAPSMLHARAGHAVVSSSSAIYALAGTGDDGQPVLEVERFDGKVWTDESTLPGHGLNATAAVVLGERLVVVGGFDTTTNVPTDRVLVYDLVARTWSEAAPLPAPRGGHAAVVLDGKVHVLGGGNSERTLAEHSVFDPATNAWSERAPLPRSEGSPAAVVLDGRIVVIGGRSGGADFGDVDIYEPVEDRWVAGPAIEPRGTAGAVVLGGAIVLFGGESQARSERLNEVLRLESRGADWRAGRWEPLAPMPTARSFARAVLLGDAVYVVGGSSGAAGGHATVGLAVVERFGPVTTPR